MRPIRYLDVCSGYSAFTLGAAGLGFQCVGYSEIEPFPRAILEQRHGAVVVDWDHRWSSSSSATPLFGDFTQIEAHHVGAVDLLTGGTPCQAFSVAGLRGGLGDERGNLTLEFLRLAERVRAEWLVWENVPGVFSAVAHDAPDPCPPAIDLDGDDGPRDGEEIVVEDEYDADESHALSCFLAGLSELGYGWAYRVLDAQYIRVDGFEGAVPQRRKRVFVVAHLGDPAGPAAVLFERESLRGDPAPRRETGEGVSATLGASLGGCSGKDDPGGRLAIGFGGGNTSGPIDAAACLTAKGQRQDFEVETFVAHALRAEGFDASEDGTGRGTPIVPCFAMQAGVTRENPDSGPRGVGVQSDIAYTLEARAEVQAVAYRITPNDGAYETGDVAASLTTGTDNSAISLVDPVAFDTTQITSATNGSNPKPGDPCHPLARGAHPPAVAFSMRGRDGEPQAEPAPEGLAPALRTTGGGSSHAFVADQWAVRRLTPTECERLMGVPDGFTAITWCGKPAADGPRYKALGNSQAGNNMRWLAHGLRAVIDAQAAA